MKGRVARYPTRKTSPTSDASKHCVNKTPRELLLRGALAFIPLDASSAPTPTGHCRPDREQRRCPDPRAPIRHSEQFRTLLSTYGAGSFILTILRTRCKTVGDKSMSTCWACGGAPPSWSFVCEECGGRGVSSKSAQEQMEMVERDYWRGSVGQYSNPFRSRPPELGFIAPAIPNQILFCR